MTIVLRLLREPLVHFLVIGALLFALYTAVSGPPPAPVNRIVVSPERVEQLAAGYQAVWRRAPTDDELRALVDNYVREEIYYREALALGLDRDDPIIRRRLQQKMEFLTDTGTDMLQPAAGELEAWYAANTERFRDVPRLAITQVFLGQEPAADRIATAQAALRSTVDIDPLELSERSLLPPRMKLSTPDAVDGVFGAGFFDQIKALPAGAWSKPVYSGYGAHLVRVDDSRPARLLTLEDVHDAVLREWRFEKAGALREQVYQQLREDYTVELPAGMSLEIP